MFMRRHVLCGFCAVLATVSFAAAELPDSVALASGYAQAFEASGKSTVAVCYIDEPGNEVIRDVRSITAYGGVLLIKVRGGAGQILDPARIVKMSFD